MATTLYRSKKNRMLGGVCGGLGEYFNIDPIIIRLVFALLAIGTGFGVILYIIAWVIIPEEDGAGYDKPHESSKEIGEQMKERIEKVGQEIDDKAREIKKSEMGSNMIGGLVLIAIGTIFLLDNFIDIDVWGRFWPLILVAIGLGLIFRSNNKE